MPFIVKFSIYEPGKQAPCICTQDRKYAYIELNAMRQKPGMALTRMTADVWAEEPLTKAERFALQLWEIRKAMHKYYNGGRRHEDMLASIELETALDRKIKADREFIDSHPGRPVRDQKAYAFFLVVEEWRRTWSERKRYGSRQGYDHQVYREMTRKLRDYEAKIDSYIKEVIGL